MKKTIAIICFLFSVLAAYTQNVYNRLDSISHAVHEKIMQNSQARWADSLLNTRDQRAKHNYDTLFIVKPQQHFTVKVHTNLTGNEMLVRGKADGIDRRMDLKAAHKVTLNFTFGFRGFNVGFALNPLKWAGKNKDFEYNLNSYSNRYGFDVIYTTANTFTGSETVDNIKHKIKTGDVRQKLLTVNGYYAFNYRKFSYPAAFTQSQIQLKSAGSWLLSCMYMGGSLRYNSDESESMPAVLHTASFGIGGGYGYNLVLPHSWLLHASATPEIVVYNHSRFLINEQRSKMPYRFPKFMTVARGAVVHNWSHYFISGSAVFHYGDWGRYRKLSLFQFKWRVRVAFGWRI